MRQPSFQQWQSMRDMSRRSQPLTVVVTEYTADGQAIERAREKMPPRADAILDELSIEVARRGLK